MSVKLSDKAFGCIGTQLAALAASHFDWKPYPAGKSYAERIRERDGWRATHPRY